MTWLATNTGWCPNCHSMMVDDECDKCDEVIEETFEELKNELKALDTGAVWRFIGISDGENETPSLREMRGLVGALKELNGEIAKMKRDGSKRGYDL